MEPLCKDSKNFSVSEVETMKNKFTLEGKKALVTGAAGGIGRSTARAFADMGADVALMDLPSAKGKLEEICAGIQERYGVKAIALAGDVADEYSVLDFVGEAARELGTLDVLHNNVGIFNPADNADIDIDEWKRLLDINLTGMLLVGRTVANVMIKDGHGGSIINMASMSGHIYNKTGDDNYSFSYPTAKAGVLHLTRGMASHYIKYGIRVNSVSPGVTLSGTHDNLPISVMENAALQVPIRRFGRLSEIAGVIAFLATDIAGFMVGSDVLIDGGQCIN